MARKAKKRPQPIGVVGKAYTFQEVLAMAQERARTQPPLTEEEHRKAMELFAKAGGGVVIGPHGITNVKGKP